MSTVLAEVRRIEETRARLVAELDAVPRAMLSAAPPSGGWSALEVVEHLVLAEESVLANMGRPELLRPRSTSLRSRLGYAAVLGVLSSPIRVSVPAAAMRPEGARSFEELRSAWEESHRALRRHVMAVEEGRISGAVFAHPVSGPLTTPQAVRMLLVHLKRHVRQIRRILTSVERARAPDPT